MSNNKENFTITRTFNAPIEDVFAAFSESDALAAWWGPAGSAITVLSLDFRKGGRFHYKLDGNGQTMWGLFRYGEIRRVDLLEFTSSFSDEQGSICRSPFPIDFPLEVFNRLTLSEQAGKTTLVLSGHPVNATEAQETTYYSMFESMNQGFTGTLDQLEVYLNQHKK